MKKLLIASVLITGLAITNPAVVLACAQKKTECAKCEAESKKCKISKLKKKVKSLWTHKDVLNISENQINKIKDIKHKAIKALIQLKADVDIVLVDLKSASWAESIDVGAVNKLIDAKYAAKNKTAKTYVKAISDIQKVLKKEQRAQWREMLKKSKRSGEKCAKYASGSSGKFCPLTGKPLDGKGSSKGSMK